MLGPGEAAARLGSALPALGVAALTAWLGVRLGGARVGLIAGLVVTANLELSLFARLVKPDLLFVLCILLAFAGLLHRFAQVSAAAQRARNRRASQSDDDEPTGMIGRAKAYILAWLADTIAEQRLLWHLRHQTEVDLHYPSDMTGGNVMRIARSSMQRDADRHRRWLAIDGILIDPLRRLDPRPRPQHHWLLFRLPRRRALPVLARRPPGPRLHRVEAGPVRAARGPPPRDRHGPAAPRAQAGGRGVAAAARSSRHVRRAPRVPAAGAAGDCLESVGRVSISSCNSANSQPGLAAGWTATGRSRSPAWPDSIRPALASSRSSAIRSSDRSSMPPAPPR